MHGNARRLVDDEQCLVLEKQGQIGTNHCTVIGRRRTLGDANGRNTQFIPKHQPIGGIGPFLVNPYFTAAQNAIDVTFRYALADSEKVIVEALTGLFVSDLGPSYGIFAYIGHFEYTGLDLRLGMKETLTLKTVEPRNLCGSFPAGLSRFSCANLRKIIQRKSWLSSLTKSSDTT
jgi:hypothetical protein